jgi:hypothetical protein
MSEFNQVRAFNLGIAQETSIEAALIYDDLVYAQKTFGKGYFFRSDEQMLNRFPIFSKSTVRRHVKLLVNAGYISTKVKKINLTPVLHYKIERSFGLVQIDQKGIVKMNKSMEMVNLNKSLLLETKEETKSPDSFSFGGNNGAASAPTPAQLRTGVEKLINIVNPKEKVTEQRVTLLRARLKDYNQEELIASAYALSQSVWHKENKQMSIDNLLAPSKIGRWYQISQDSKVDPEKAAARARSEKRTDEEMKAFREGRREEWLLENPE